MTESNPEWFYISGGERLGPVMFHELRTRYENGDINERTLVWTKDFADDWRRLGEVSGMKKVTEPPLVPTSQINNFWLFMLVSVPLLFIVVDLILGQMVSDQFGWETLPSLSFFLFFLANSLCAMLDQNAVERSGRGSSVENLLLWIIMLVPVYIYLRSKRTGVGSWPLFAWVVALGLAGFASIGWPSGTYFGSGLPACDSKASLKTVKDLYTDIPINFSRAIALSLTEIEEVQYSERSGQRGCRAVVQDTTGKFIPITYTISEKDNQIYFHIQLAGF